MSDPEDDHNLPRLFTDGQRGSHRQRRDRMGRWAALALTLTVLALGTVIWLGTAGTGQEASVPTITAAAGAYKKRPGDPGGRDIAHRESTVFRALQGDSTSADNNHNRIENLASREDTDAPLPADRFYDDLDTSMQQLAEQGGKEGDAATHKTKAAQESAIGSNNKTAMRLASDDDGNEDTLAFVREVLQKKDKIEEQQQAMQQKQDGQLDPGDSAGEKLPSKPDRGDRRGPDANSDDGANVPAPEEGKNIGKQADSFPHHYVQLGSFRKKSAAERAWKRALNQYSVLEGMSRDIQRADLGQRGVYYRVLVGPITKMRARETCSTIKKNDKNGCLIVGSMQ